MKSYLVVAALVVAASTARAETVIVSGVELRLPADWERRAKGPRTLLAPKKHKGRAIEVIALKRMPAPTPEDFRAFKALLGGEHLELASVKMGSRDGAKVISANGKLVTPKGDVAVDVLVVPVKKKAAMLVSFVGSDQDPVIKTANVGILASARIPGPRISFAHAPAKRPGLIEPPRPLIEGLVKIAKAFDTSLRLPRPLVVRFQECGTVNAFYNSARHEIQMCHELFDDLVKLFAGAGMDKKRAAQTAVGTYMFVFLHELGHALVGELALPITGKGEDAADEIATLILAKTPKTQQIALAGATWFELKTKQPQHQNRYWSTHSFDSVRFESILCLLYGADPKALAPVMAKYKVPRGKLGKCARDTPARLAAWKQLLAPYAVKR